MALPPQPPQAPDAPLFWIDVDDGYQLYVTDKALSIGEDCPPDAQYVPVNQNAGGTPLPTALVDNSGAGGITFERTEHGFMPQVDLEQLAEVLAQKIIDRPTIGGVSIGDGKVVVGGQSIVIPPSAGVPEKQAQIETRGGSVVIDPERSDAFIVEAHRNLHLRLSSPPQRTQTVKISVQVAGPFAVDVSYDGFVPAHGKVLPEYLKPGSSHEILIVSDGKRAYGVPVVLDPGTTVEGVRGKLIHTYKQAAFANPYPPEGVTLFICATDNPKFFGDEGPEISFPKGDIILDTPPVFEDASQIYVVHSDRSPSFPLGVGPNASQSMAWINVPGDSVKVTHVDSDEDGVVEIPPFLGSGIQLAIISDSSESGVLTWTKQAGFTPIQSNHETPAKARWRGMTIAYRTAGGNAAAVFDVDTEHTVALLEIS